MAIDVCYKTVTEQRADITHTELVSDPATCVGCAACGVSSSWCATLRKDHACQKKLAVIVKLITLAIERRQEQAIGPIVMALLDGQTAGILGDRPQ